MPSVEAANTESVQEAGSKDHHHHHHHKHKHTHDSDKADGVWVDSADLTVKVDRGEEITDEVSSRSNKQLPRGWRQHLDPKTNYPYYENVKSRAVQWERPTEDVEGISEWELFKAAARQRGEQLQAKLNKRIEKTVELLGKGRFGEWKREEMILVLVMRGREVRGELEIHELTLRDMCEEEFLEETVMPDKPQSSITPENFWRITKAVLRIQHNFFQRRLERETAKAIALSEEEANGTSQFDDYIVSDIPDGGEDGDIEALANGTTETGASRTSSTTLDSHGEASGQGKSPTKSAQLHRTFLKYLDQPWTPPDWHKSQVFQNFYKPRRWGKGETNPKFEFFKTTTGRHCCHGFVGEQCDIWHEGVVSEFGIFGAAVTNYFKFLKFLFWLFLVLSLVGLPDLVLNIFGPQGGHLTGGLADIAVTSIGNLAPSQVISNATSTLFVRVPGCYEGGYYDFNCDMTKERVGLFYAWLDVIVVVILLVSFVWLTVFESKEEASLNKFTVTTSMFSVTVSNLPEDSTEVEIKNALKTAMVHQGFPKPKIQTIFMGYDNENEIKKATKRGVLLKRKVELTEKHRYDVTQIRSSDDGGSTDEKKAAHIAKLRKNFLSELSKVSALIRYEDQYFEKVTATKEHVLCAFITFSRVEDAINCVKTYSMSNTGFFKQMCGLSPQMLFKGKILRASRAPEPSTIIWENLRYTVSERFGRRLLTTIVTLFLTILSILVCFGAKALQEQVQTDGGSALCPSGFGGLSRDQQREFVRSAGNSKYLHCYCSNLAYSDRASDSTCRQLYISVGKAEAITVFASLVVVIVNFLMEVAIQKLVVVRLLLLFLFLFLFLSLFLS